MITTLFRRLDVGPGTRLLDVACGSGPAVRLAGSLGAKAAALDAAADLVAVARTRSPGVDVRVGSMFDLPWPDSACDAVVSINGIWGGCTDALAEAHGVRRPGGLIGISFWGVGPPLDVRECFRAFARHAPENHLAAMRRLNGILRLRNDHRFVVAQRSADG
ncbi:class I SAM-dependent methyltransferase [Pseudonocardia sp. RS010]|uniref:class I SAM-dependent methyltransferase n=1 Tax=Pseudonocardia sp. RS010 TaxID=3385979 RepID=UPI0039A1C879